MVKRSVLRLLEQGSVRSLLSPFRRNCAAIFMLHRFHDPEHGVDGHTPAELRRTLEYLRAHHFELLSLGGLFDRLESGDALSGAVVFTIDDGYYDHARIASPVFSEYDCPVTTFVSTGFLDNELWFWWDQISYVFERTSSDAFTGSVGDTHIAWQGSNGRTSGAHRFIEHCKELPDEAKHRAIESLALALEVDLPESAPHNYAPMTWSDLRASEARGMTFAPHTITHPILSRTSDSQAEREIAGSWARLREEATAPVPIFCYPNGQPSDFGEREINIIRSAGLRGAVVGEPGYARVATFRAAPNNPFRVRRFAYPEDFIDVLQVVTGFERLKQTIRPGGEA
jgi:peptidoglycan/xylan/chitin deacetylase (PgdA/CDA1 family)